MKNKTINGIFEKLVEFKEKQVESAKSSKPRDLTNPFFTETSALIKSRGPHHHSINILIHHNKKALRAAT